MTLPDIVTKQDRLLTASTSASTFGVVGLASALRIECKPRGIDVTIVCSPEVVTGFRAKLTRALAPLFHGLMNRITDRMVADALRRHPA